MKETRKYADRRLYLINGVSKRRKKLRETAVDYGGAKCSICGYNKRSQVLEFHHLDSEKKGFWDLPKWVFQVMGEGKG